MSANIDLGTYDASDWSVGFTDDFASLYAGDDYLYGRKDGYSVTARLMDGNDRVEIYSGSSNDVNTNMGFDYIIAYGGNGMLRAGKDADEIIIAGGEYNHINGNNGSDVITNYSKFAGTIYGGKDDDILINAGGGGYFYGNLGNDTFRPYAIDPDGLETELMIINDFVLGSDYLDTSYLGSWEVNYIDNSTYITNINADSSKTLVAVLKNVIW